MTLGGKGVATGPGPRDHRRTVELRGWIASSGFASGDRFVVGHWTRSPVGPITDVMWAAPDGTRTLLAPHEAAAAFITAVYAFDDVVVAPVDGTLGTDGLRVASPRLELHLRPHRLRLPLPGRLLPPWAWRVLAAPVARVVMGVDVHGTSPTGVQEWYRAWSWAPLRAASATLDSADLGAMADVAPPVGVGFSEPPRRPSLVRVDPLLRDAGGRLDAALAG